MKVYISNLTNSCQKIHVLFENRIEKRDKYNEN